MRKREAARYLMEVHARPVRRSCACVGLSEAAWYRPPLDWTVRDAELIDALARLVEERSSRGPARRACATEVLGTAWSTFRTASSEF